MAEEKTEVEKACEFFSCGGSMLDENDMIYYMGVLLCDLYQQTV